MLYAVSQFIVFFFRGSEPFTPFLGINGLKQAQWTAIIVFLVCIPLFIYVQRASRPWPYSAKNPVPWPPNASDNDARFAGIDRREEQLRLQRPRRPPECARVPSPRHPATRSTALAANTRDWWPPAQYLRQRRTRRLAISQKVYASDGFANSELVDETCAFCARRRLSGVLDETEHFFLLADHAPLIEGHLLIIPRAHYACYGAVPEGLEQRAAGDQGARRRFLSAAYREPVFFEHGVFRQTVYHAHLHAMPFGSVPLNLAALSRMKLAGMRRPLQDVRDWYAEQGHYFYLECPAPEGKPMAMLFPLTSTNIFRSLARCAPPPARWQPGSHSRCGA